MARHGIVAAGVVALIFAAAAASAPSPSLFPLADGNRWLLSDGARARTAISVERRGPAYVLDGFPGTAALRVRAAGQAVQAWDAGQARWEPFLRLDARAGTTYVVDLTGTALWRSVVVTVVSRQTRLEETSACGAAGCTVLSFRSRGKTVDAAKRWRQMRLLLVAGGPLQAAAVMIVSRGSAGVQACLGYTIGAHRRNSCAYESSARF